MTPIDWVFLSLFIYSLAGVFIGTFAGAEVNGGLSVNQCVALGALWPFAIAISAFRGVAEFHHESKHKRFIREERRRLEVEREFKRIQVEIEKEVTG